MGSEHEKLRGLRGGNKFRVERVSGSVADWRGAGMATFLVWCLLLVVCWPLALLAVIVYPFVWLLMLPFRLVGIAVGGVFELLRAIIFLPARVLRGPRTA